MLWFNFIFGLNFIVLCFWVWWILLINRELGHYRAILYRGLRFPCNDRTDEVNKFLYGLFIMNLSLWSVKTNNCPANNFKKHKFHLNELYTLARDTVRWHWSADTLLDSCQLIITWMSIRMSNIKLNADCICLGHLVSNARSLQENSQSERAYYCSHILMNVNDFETKENKI